MYSGHTTQTVQPSLSGAEVLPEANEEQIQEAQRMCSELHYAYYSRPPRGSWRWYDWDADWTDLLCDLCTLLSTARFTELPEIAVAAVYRCNQIASGAMGKFDFEGMHPADSDRPNTEPPPGVERLDYRATNHGEVSLLAEGELSGTWWKRGGAWLKTWAGLGG